MEGSARNEFLHSLTDCLRKYERDSGLTLQTVTRAECHDKGLNFMSEITKLNIIGKYRNGREYRKSLIMKQPLPRSPLSESFRAHEAFVNELFVYEALLPALKGEDDGAPMAWPDLIMAREDCLILEDLNEVGYRMVKDKDGLDLRHCEVVVKEIASFHAKSILLKHKDRSKFDEVGSNLHHIVFSEEGRGYFSEMLELSFARGLDSYKEKKGNGSKRTWAHLEPFRGKIFDLMYAMSKSNHSSLSVTCHGDLWLNNLMFRYDPQGEVVDVKLFDFQASSLAHPSTDLMRFLYTSTSSHTRRRHLTHLIQLYLQTVLQEITTDGPIPEDLIVNLEFDNFYGDFRNRSLYGFVTAVWLLPVITMDMKQKLFSRDIDADSCVSDSDGIQLDNIKIPSEDELRKILCNDDYHKKIEELIEEFSDNCWLKVDVDCIWRKYEK